MIRNHETKSYEAICALSGQRKWALSGTPIHIRTEDLSALFTFIGYSSILPNQRSQTGLDELRKILQTLCLRRTNDGVDLGLPKREKLLEELSFSHDERLQYNRVYGTGPDALVHLQNPLTRLLQLRMICDHGDLLPDKSWLKADSTLCPNCHRCVGIFELEGCPHRQLCAICVEQLSISKPDDCPECLKESQFPDAMDIEPEQPASQLAYRGTSTKVHALIRNIHDDSKSPDIPKQYVSSISVS